VSPQPILGYVISEGIV